MSIGAAGGDAVVEALWRAHSGGEPAPAPTRMVPGLDLESAYAIQRTLIDRHVRAGQKLIGWKVGMTSVTAPPGSPGPIYGRLLSGMVLDDETGIPHAGLHEPHTEAEIAFVLRTDLHGPGVGVEDVLAVTEGVRPAIEVFSRRLEPTARNVCDHVADNSLSTGVALGALTGDLGLFDRRLTGVVFRRGQEVVATGAGAQALGDPARSVAWLANALHETGEGLHAGDVVLTGALAGAHLARAGDRFEAEFDRLGGVGVTFR